MCSSNTLHAKVFSTQIFQYLRQILPRVCTLVLFIIIITCPYSTCISSFLAAASLLLCTFKKCFFVLGWRLEVYICTYVDDIHHSQPSWLYYIRLDSAHKFQNDVATWASRYSCVQKWKNYSPIATYVLANCIFNVIFQTVLHITTVGELRRLGMIMLHNDRMTMHTEIAYICCF